MRLDVFHVFVLVLNYHFEGLNFALELFNLSLLIELVFRITILVFAINLIDQFFVLLLESEYFSLHDFNFVSQSFLNGVGIVHLLNFIGWSEEILLDQVFHIVDVVNHCFEGVGRFTVFTDDLV